MLIDDPRNVRKLAQVTGTKFVVLAALAAAVGFAAERLGVAGMLFPARLVGILVAAVSIFLAFRINVGYSRWWLARQVWGGLVNESRSLGMYLVAMLRDGDGPAAGAGDADSGQARRRRIVLRHIGYVNALRLQLRRQGPADWEREIWGRRVNGRPLFADDEAARLRAAGNVATQILTLQAADIADWFARSGDGRGDDYRQVKLAELLRELYIRQGQSEAIKNTVLAWGYAAYTRLLARALAAIVVFSQLNSFSIAGALLVAFIATVFLTIEQVGRNLDNPFEGAFNDTPLSSICRTIEIDLLQQIGEPCDLAPVAPADGRLD